MVYPVLRIAVATFLVAAAPDLSLAADITLPPAHTIATNNQTFIFRTTPIPAVVQDSIVTLKAACLVWPLKPVTTSAAANTVTRNDSQSWLFASSLCDAVLDDDWFTNTSTKLMWFGAGLGVVTLLFAQAVWLYLRIALTALRRRFRVQPTAAFTLRD